MATMNEDSNSNKPLFRDLDASEADGELETSEIESLCMNCENKVRVCILYTYFYEERCDSGGGPPNYSL